MMHLMSNLQLNLKNSAHPNSAVYPGEKGGLGGGGLATIFGRKNALARGGGRGLLQLLLLL